MSYPRNVSSQLTVKHQQMSLPYRQSLVRRKPDRRSPFDVVKQSSLGDQHAETSVILTRPDTVCGVVGAGDDVNLESSFHTSFIKAQIYACAIAIKGLDIRQTCKNAGPLPCTKCSEILRQGCLIPEKLLHMCHGYTKQWLSERDVSWWIERFPATKLQNLEKSSDAHAGPDLFKAVGAWSVDLKCDHAREAFLLSSRIDTVPESGQGLIDAKSRSLVLNDEENTKKREEIIGTQLVGEVYSTGTPEARTLQSHFPPKSEDDEYIDTTNHGNDTYPQKDSVLVKSQDEGLSTCIARPICVRGASDFGITSVPASSFDSDRNSHSHTSGLSSNDQNNRQSYLDSRKRKRSSKSSGHDGSDDDENLPAHRLSNAMPLEDTAARLACHFHMYKPYKYCANSSNGKTYKTCPVGFKDSKDLRDHIKKKHCGPKHLCSRCHGEFNDAAEKGAHEILVPRCESARNEMYETEKFILTGTNRRVQFDAMKKPKNTSHEEHWFDTWSVIFPGHPFPTTPYMPHDAFDVAYSRITEEEINQFMHVQTRQLSDVGFNVEMRRSLRHFVDRVRERLRDESQPERLFRSSLSDGFEDGLGQPAPAGQSSNVNFVESIHGQDQIVDHHLIYNPPSIRITDMTTTSHGNNSAPFWNGIIPQPSIANFDARDDSVLQNNHDINAVGNGGGFYQYYDQNQDFHDFDVYSGSGSNSSLYDRGQHGSWDFDHGQ